MLSLQRKKKNHLVINIMGKFTFFKKSILALGLSAFALCAFAQEADKTEAKPNRKDFKSYFYVTADAGVNALSGDVNKIKPNFNGNIGLGWQFDNILGFKGNIGGGLRIIKAFCAEKKMNVRFDSINTMYRNDIMKVNIRQQMAHPMSEFLGTVMIVIVLWFGQ